MSVTILDLNFVAFEPPTLEPDTPGTTVWNDGDKGPVAYGATRDGWHWLRLAGAGTYRFPIEPSGSTVAADVVPEAGARRELVVDSYYRSVVPLALQAYGFEVLHGSAVALPSGVVALCADRETGKSTIAYALQRRGHVVVADDSVVLSVVERPDGASATSALEPRPTSGVRVHPMPFALRLRAPTVEHYALPQRRAATVDGDTPFHPANDLTLDAIVLLSRDDPSAGAVRLTRLDANQAFSSVLSQSHAFTLVHGDRKRTMMRSYLRLVDRVPVYRLTYPTGLEHLTAICEHVEALSGRAELAGSREM